MALYQVAKEQWHKAAMFYENKLAEDFVDVYPTPAVEERMRIKLSKIQQYMMAHETALVWRIKPRLIFRQFNYGIEPDLEGTTLSVELI